MRKHRALEFGTQNNMVCILKRETDRERERERQREREIERREI